MENSKSLTKYLFRYFWVLAVVFAISLSISNIIFDEYYKSKIVKNFCLSVYNTTMESLDQWGELFEELYFLTRDELSQILDEMYSFLKKSSPTDQEISQKLHSLLKNRKDKVNWYIINQSGIIERTDYATDLGIDISEKKDYWKVISGLKPSEKHFDPLTFEIKTNNPRLFTYIKLPNEYLFEIGITIEKKPFEKLLENIEFRKRQVLFLKEISIFNTSLAPISPYFNLTGTDKKLFNEIDSQSFIIYNAGKWLHNIYSKWHPGNLPFDFYLKIQIDLSIFGKLKNLIFWTFNLIILLLSTVSILSTYALSRGIQKSLKILFDHVKHNSKISKKTGVIEIDQLIDRYDSLIKQLNEQLEEKEKFTGLLSKEISQKNKLQKRLEKLALTDELTGVYNRYAALKILSAYLKTNRFKITICYFDIDHLKLINDSIGHSAGDNLLKFVVEVVKRCVRKSDKIARIGGDEFLIVFPNSSEKEVKFIMERVNSSLNNEKPDEFKSFEVSISYGLIELEPNSSLDIDDILKIADKRMYQNKRSKKK